MAPKSDHNDALNNSARTNRIPKDADRIYGEDVRGGYIARPLKDSEPHVTLVEQFVLLGGENYQTGYPINRIDWASGARKKYRLKTFAVGRTVKPRTLGLGSIQGNGVLLGGNSPLATTQAQPPAKLTEVASNHGPKQPDTEASPNKPMPDSAVNFLDRKRSDTEAENPLFCAHVEKHHANFDPYRLTLPNGQRPVPKDLTVVQTLRDIFESSQPFRDYQKPLMECLPLAAGIDPASINVFRGTWPIHDPKAVHGIAKSHNDFFDKLQQVHVPKGTVHWIMRGCNSPKPILEPQVDPDKPIDGQESDIRCAQAEENLHDILQYHPFSRLQGTSNAQETIMSRERSTAASRYSYVPSFLDQGEIETFQHPHSSNDIKEFAAEGLAIEWNINNTRNEVLRRFCEGSRATLPSSGVNHIEFEMSSNEVVYSDTMIHIEDLECQLKRLRAESGIPLPPERVTNDPAPLSYDPLSHDLTEEQKLLEKIRIAKEAAEVFGPDLKLPSPPKNFNGRNASDLDMDTNMENSMDGINVISQENACPYSESTGDESVPWPDFVSADADALWDRYKHDVASAQEVGTAIKGEEVRNKRTTSSGDGPPRKRIRGDKDVQGNTIMGNTELDTSKLSEPRSVGKGLSAPPRRPRKSHFSSRNSSQLRLPAPSTPRESEKELTYQTPNQHSGPKEAGITDNTPIRIGLPTSSSKKSGREMVTVTFTSVMNRLVGIAVIETAAKQHPRSASIKTLANFDEEAVDVKVTGSTGFNLEEFIREHILEEWIQDITQEHN